MCHRGYCCCHPGETKLPYTQLPCDIVTLLLSQCDTKIPDKTGMWMFQTLVSLCEICWHFQTLLPHCILNLQIRKKWWLRWAFCSTFRKSRTIIMKCLKFRKNRNGYIFSGSNFVWSFHSLVCAVCGSGCGNWPLICYQQNQTGILLQ